MSDPRPDPDPSKTTPLSGVASASGSSIGGKQPSLEDTVHALQSAAKEGTSVDTLIARLVVDQGLATREEVADLTMMGSARFTTAAGQLTGPQVAFSVRELDPPFELGLQEGVTYGPLDTQDRSFYFLVAEARKAGPPDDLASVEERVRADLKTAAAYEDLVERSEEVRRRVVENLSITTLYDTFPDAIFAAIEAEVTRNGVRSPEGTAVPMRQANVPALREAIVDRIAEWEPLTAPRAMDLDPRVLAVPLPSERSLAIAIIRGRLPVTTEQLRRADGSVVGTAQREYLDQVAANPLSFESVSARLGYERVGRLDDDEEEDLAEGEAGGEGSDAS